MAATDTYTLSEEEEEDDVVEYFAAAFQDTSSGPVLRSDAAQDGALVILEGDRADEDDLPIQQPMADDPPVHPVPRMQGAFEESILESGEEACSRRDVPANPRTRHLRMLDEEEYNSSYNLRFRRAQRAKHHPLWKLMAQIAFGVHLLHQLLAKSNDEVIRILQTHVDEVDGWIETTKEDLDFSTADIRERILHLKTPLEHTHIFDSMLEDPDFRCSIVEGNQRIERMIARTSVALKDSTTDIHQGNEATSELAAYLRRLTQNNMRQTHEIAATMKAMKGNAEGWLDCIGKLQGKANTLGLVLQQLRGILAEMAKRAGLAGRRSVIARRASANNSPIEMPPRLLTPPPVSRYAQSNDSSGALASISTRGLFPHKPLPPTPASLNHGNKFDTARDSLVGREFPYPQPRSSTQLILRRPRTTEDLGMRTETSLWDLDDDAMARQDGGKQTRSRTSSAKRAGQSASRERHRSSSRTGTRVGEKSESRILERLRDVASENLVPLRAKWTARLKEKGSTLSLASKKSSHSRGESLHKTLTRTWSLRSPQPAELIETDNRSIQASTHSRKDSASSFRRHRSVSDRRGLWSSATSDSIFASRRSTDTRTTIVAPDQASRAQSPQLALDIVATNSRTHSPTQFKPLPSILQSESSSENSRRTSNALALMMQPASLSPLHGSTRSSSPNTSSKQTNSWRKTSSSNDTTTIPEASIINDEKELEKTAWKRYHAPSPSNEPRVKSMIEPRKELLILPPQATTSAAKKKLGTLKAIFR